MNNISPKRSVTIYPEAYSEVYVPMSLVNGRYLAVFEDGNITVYKREIDRISKAATLKRQMFQNMLLLDTSSGIYLKTESQILHCRCLTKNSSMNIYL